jgi:adenylate kinase
VGQANVLGKILAENGHTLDAVLEFQVPEEELVKRLLARGRSDDTEDVIRRRLEIYRSETAPVLDHYRDLLVPVAAVGDIDEVSQRALAALPAK